MVPALGLEVFTISEGEGPEAVVLLHGFPSSSFDFHLCWDALATGRRLVTLDYPGFGFSAKPEDFSYSLMEQADVVELVLRRLGVTRATLVAHDMGTSVTTELLARRESGLLSFAIDRVVLMNGSVHIELSQLAVSQKLLRIPRLGRMFARLASRRLFGAQLRRILGRPLPEQEIDDMFELVGLDGGRARLPQIIRYIDERWRFPRRWLGPLGRLDLPVLILWGARDTVAVMAIGERLAADIPGARLQRMDDLGHYPQLEDPAQVTRALLEFLGPAGRRGAGGSAA